MHSMIQIILNIEVCSTIARACPSLCKRFTEGLSQVFVSVGLRYTLVGSDDYDKGAELLELFKNHLLSLCMCRDSLCQQQCQLLECFTYLAFFPLCIEFKLFDAKFVSIREEQFPLSKNGMSCLFKVKDLSNQLDYEKAGTF